MLFSGQAMSQKDFVQDRPNAASLKRVLSERNKPELLTTNNERQDSMIRTLNDLQRNIFLYGIEKVRPFKNIEKIGKKKIQIFSFCLRDLLSFHLLNLG